MTKHFEQLKAEGVRLEQAIRENLKGLGHGD